jgi:uncharacterized cofD-like protein
MVNEKDRKRKHRWQAMLQELRWLIPGIGVKRWLLLILAGTTLLGIGLAVFTLDVYRSAPDTWWLPVLSTLSLRFIDRPIRVLIFGTLGVGLVLSGIWGFNRTLLRPFIRPGKTVIEAVSDYRRRDRGPRIVAIGGGHGLSNLLRGLKAYTHNITAIVTVADDGGSSGELRRSMGILPPGDIRNCLAALSNDEALLTQIFQYRFATGDGLSGHTLGNLFISALTDITGSFEEAVAESGRVLAVHGQVIPATLHDVHLVADVEMADTKKRVQVSGESNIPKTAGKIKRVWLEPGNAPAFPPAIAAILSADLIIVGPGSLYTSLLPNLLVSDLAEAIRASRAIKFYVCNVATQPGETDGYSSTDHLYTLEKHVTGRLFDLIICNRRYDGLLPQGIGWVKTDPNLEENYAVYQADLIDEENPWRHDSTKLAQVINDLFYERTGPLAD